VTSIEVGIYAEYGRETAMEDTEFIGNGGQARPEDFGSVEYPSPRLSDATSDTLSALGLTGSVVCSFELY